ncbi:hypothetical protein HMPREF1207_03966 [Paenibacillus sp. HGH0039]|nr:hypothetical protein HMPREF1207_03966 [Paenibacillus sp. HGH0039]
MEKNAFCFKDVPGIACLKVVSGSASIPVSLNKYAIRLAHICSLVHTNHKKRLPISSLLIGNLFVFCYDVDRFTT